MRPCPGPHSRRCSWVLPSAPGAVRASRWSDVTTYRRAATTEAPLGISTRAELELSAQAASMSPALRRQITLRSASTSARDVVSASQPPARSRFELPAITRSPRTVPPKTRLDAGSGSSGWAWTVARTVVIAARHPTAIARAPRRAEDRRRLWLDMSSPSSGCNDSAAIATLRRRPLSRCDGTWNRRRDTAAIPGRGRGGCGLLPVARGAELPARRTARFPGLHRRVSPAYQA